MTISDRTYDTLKRLHSLTGVVPVGLFLLEHFFTNSYAVQGPIAYNRASAEIAHLPYVQLLELFLIGIPILFHMVLGIVIATTGQANAGRHGYARNWMYLLQRVSGIYLVFYIIYHVWVTRFSPEVLRGDTDLFGLMSRQLQNAGVLAFYVGGILSASYHFGNGLFGFSIHWGLATGRSAQRIAARLGFVVFVVLFLVGLNSLWAFRGHPIRMFDRGGEPTAQVLEVGR